MRSFLICFGILFLFSFPVKHLSAQPADSTKITLSPESGFYIESVDGFMGFKVSTRLQQQFGMLVPLSEKDALQSEIAIRRARIRIHGFFYEKKLTYFLQLQMDRGNLLLSNAEFRWKATDNLQLNFGQLWPVAGRQFRTTSDVFQMIDRSPVARFFSPGYDIGANAQYNFNFGGEGLIKSYLSITHGEGMNKASAAGGFAYASRVELLPLGDFIQNGDYTESDIHREQSPKLSVAAALYYNQDAYSVIGNEATSANWDGINDDIASLYVDALFKYDGFSLLAEYADRTVDNEILQVNNGPATYSFISGGNGFTAQAGKFISEKLEPTVRMSILNPTNELQEARGKFTQQNTYTLGLNHFLRGHSIKLQLEMNLVNEQFLNSEDHTYFQLLSQFSVSF